MEKKPWYKSKIALLAFTASALIIGNLTFQFVGANGITDAQIEAAGQLQPSVTQAFQDIKSGQNIFQVLTALAFSLIGFWRIWFTNTVIA